MEQPEKLTFLNELSPSFGPSGELISVGFFYLGTFLQAAHEVIAEPMAVVKSLDSTFVVPHLNSEKKLKLIFFVSQINKKTHIITL